MILVHIMDGSCHRLRTRSDHLGIKMVDNFFGIFHTLEEGRRHAILVHQGVLEASEFTLLVHKCHSRHHRAENQLGVVLEEINLMLDGIS